MLKRAYATLRCPPLEAAADGLRTITCCPDSFHMGREAVPLRIRHADGIIRDPGSLAVPRAVDGDDETTGRTPDADFRLGGGAMGVEWWFAATLLWLWRRRAMRAWPHRMEASN